MLAVYRLVYLFIVLQAHLLSETNLTFMPLLKLYKAFLLLYTSNTYFIMHLLAVNFCSYQI